MKSQRRIWEIQHQTVCKVIGMAFSARDLRKIASKFGISPQDPLMDLDFALHSTAVHLCGSDNRVSRHIQKMIENRFVRYSKILSDTDPIELISAVTERPQDLNVPLWAILWDLSTRGIENGASVETALFGFVHMLEHRLLKEFWEPQSRNQQRENGEKEGPDQILVLKRQLLNLQRETERSRKLSDNLRRQIETMKRPVRRSGMSVVQREAPRRQVDPDSAEKIKRLRNLLEEARAQKHSLRQQCSRLRAELQVLVSEVSVRATQCSAGDENSHQGSCPEGKALGGKRIAMVGGIDSLECYYRQLVEEMGGTFHRHNGSCQSGDCNVETCVRKADLVVCPIDVNSHNATKAAKKICKRYGIPCCFPRTAGLTGLRMAIEKYNEEMEVA